MIKLLILQTTTPSEGFGSMMFPMIALLAVFYLFMILPQNRKRKKVYIRIKKRFKSSNFKWYSRKVG